MRGKAAGWLVGFVVLAPVSACGGSDGSAAGREIAMEAGAFVPKTLTVERGATVTFVNESGTGKWPASDDHPTHELYPGFDAGRVVRDGESWSFAFEHAGRWGYHDHLAPEVRGEVVVE